MSKQVSKKSNASNIAKKSLFLFLKSLKWTFIFGIIMSFLGGGAVFGYVTALVKDEPIRDKETIFKKMQENAITGFVYFNDESVVGQLRTEEDRRLIAKKDIPKFVTDAFLATEDKEFENHHGIDFRGLARAVLQKVMREDVQTGGSTITQQLARRVFLSLDKTASRKVKEIFLSLRIERYMSKDEILVAYLNKIPFGNGSSGYNLYGIKAAAKGIFDVNDLSDLNIAQAAYLAGLPQQPSTYSAFTSKGEFDEEGFSLAHNRQQQIVLKRMLEEQKISQQEYAEAVSFDLKASLAQPKKKAYTTYPYLMLEAERKAAEILLRLKYPELTEEDFRGPEYAQLLADAREHMLRGGYKIYTTIDKTIYDKMQEISHNPENFTPDDPVKGVEQIGAVMIDNKTGAILGMIEGRDFYIEQMNHATQMLRQPGSTMKPVAAYIPALEKGIIQPAGIIDDVPIILADGTKGFHIPENWNGKYHGLITARHALNQSYNIPAIKLFLSDEIGISVGWDYAKKMGITSLTKEDNHAQTGVIGGLKYGVSVKDLANAYATMGNNGVFNNAYLIRKIEDAEGQIVYEHKANPTLVFSEETAYLITDMLRTVVTSGTAADLMKRYHYHKKVPIVGKTGSTQGDADAWFMGYSPDITVGVWAGYDQPIHKLSSKTGGTQRAKIIWSAIMNAAVELRPELFPTKRFERPENIIEMTVSDLSGKLPSDLVRETNHLVTDLFNKKFIPTEEDDMLVRMNVISYNNFNYIANPLTPPDMTQEKLLIKRERPIKSIIDQIAGLFEKYPKSVPTKKGNVPKTPEDYYPLGLDNEAPTEADPRVDDGDVPDAPTDVVLEKKTGSVTITFQPNGIADVVGYRLYRSMNGGPYVAVSGAVVLTGQPPKFMNYISESNFYAYYVTAVDVIGNESPASKVVLSNGNTIDLGTDLFPSEPNGQEDNGNSSEQTEQISTTAPSTPANVAVTARDGGIGITMSWDANPEDEGVYRYDVYYSGDENSLYRKIGETTSNNFEYINIPVEGWYRVIAVSEAGVSAPSDSVKHKEE
jgi:penicillin-binding protein